MFISGVLLAEWSVLYVIIASFVIVVALGFLSWMVICCCKRWDWDYTPHCIQASQPSICSRRLKIQTSRSSAEPWDVGFSHLSVSSDMLKSWNSGLC